MILKSVCRWLRQGVCPVKRVREELTATLQKADVVTGRKAKKEDGRGVSAGERVGQVRAVGSSKTKNVGQVSDGKGHEQRESYLWLKSKNCESLGGIWARPRGVNLVFCDGKDVKQFAGSTQYQK